MTQTTTGIRFQVAPTTVLSTGARAWVIVDTVDLNGFGGAARVGGLFKSPESAQRKADALNAATKTPYPLTEQQAQDLADRVNAAPGLIGRASIVYHARSGRWGVILTDRVGCDVNLGQTVEHVEAFLASHDAKYFAAPAAPAEVPAPTASAPNSLDYSSTQLDAPERVQRIIADACQRSLDAKRLIWVASFDPGAEWGTGRCWYNTDCEPSTADRIEGIARSGHYMPVGSPR